MPPKEGSAAKKQKVDIGKTKKKKDSGPRLEPGEPTKTNTFLPKGWQLEGQCAAYLGFTQIQHLRKFAVCPIVLDAFVEGEQDFTKAKHSKVLEILRDCPDDMKSNDDPLTKYPPEDTHKRAWRVALIVAQLRRAIQRTYSAGLAFDREKIEDSCSSFDTASVASSDVPRLDPDDPLVSPKLGPFPDLKEDDLEAYNRVYFILRYLTYSTQSPWAKRFGSNEWDRQVMVDDSHVPHWMRPKATPSEATAPDVPMKPVGLTAPEKPMRKLKIIWLFKDKSKPAIEFRRLREEEEEAGMQEHTKPLLQQKITVADETSIEEFRNSIRTSYELELLGAQINKLSLCRYLQDGDREEFGITFESWGEQVKEQLWLPDLDIEKSVFQFTVRPAEPGEVILEEAVAAALRQVFVMKDGDMTSIIPAEVENTGDPGPTYDGIMHALGESNNQRKFLDPMKLFDGRREDMLRFFHPDDPTTPEGLKAYQRRVYKHVMKEPEPIIIQDKMARFIGRGKSRVTLTADELAACAAAKEESEHVALSSGEDDSDFYNLNQLHTGTVAQVGPPLHPSAMALELEPFHDAKGRLMYRNLGPTLMKPVFYPWQVTGVVGALIGAFGYVPVREDAPDTVKQAADSLRGLAIGGKMVCDQTGLGKTLILLATFFYATRHVAGGHKGKGKKGKQSEHYKMLVLVVPAAVIKQWAEAIIDNFPSLELIINYDSSSLPQAKFSKSFISATQMKEFPNVGSWPTQFQHLSNSKDPKVGRTILLSSIDTFVMRTLVKETIVVMTDGKPVDTTVYRNRLEGHVSAAGIDEGQKFKDEATLRWKALNSMKAPVNWILGATPMANTSRDFIAQLKILWNNAKPLLEQDTDAFEWFKKRSGTMELWSDGESIADSLDNRRLAFLCPDSVRRLLNQSKKVDIAKFFPLMENLVCIKRFMGSKLPLDFNTDEVFELKTAMEPYTISTLKCAFHPLEQNLHQWLHRETSRRFIAVRRGHSETQARSSGKDKILYPMAEMRELLIGTMSSYLRLFHEVCKGINTDTLVSTIQEYSGQGFDGFRFVRFLCTKLSLTLPATALEYVEFICNGSPMLRAVIQKISKNDAYLEPRQNGKFLIAEDVPLNAHFLEWALCMMGFNVVVFHSGLSPKERHDLQDDFCNPNSDISGMVMLHDVGGTGLNFWADCALVIRCTSAKNEAGDSQAIGRAIRVPQPRRVEVVKIWVENSICAYRESRKRDKYLTELATRANDPVIRSLLVKCLNLFQKTVLAAHQDPENKQLLQKLQRGIIPVQVSEKVAEVTEGKRDRKKTGLHTDTAFGDDTGELRIPGPFDSDHEYTDEEDGEEDEEFGIEDDESKESAVEDEQDEDYESGFEDEIDDDTESSPELDDSTSQHGGLNQLKAARTRKRAAKLFYREDQLEEGVRQLELLLRADPNKVYTLKDLEDEATLIRGIEIAHCMRSGGKMDEITSIHINYDAIKHQMSPAVLEEIRTDGDAKRKLMALLQSEKQFDPTAPISPAD